MQEQYHDVFKIVVLGDAAVGKSNMIKNYIQNAQDLRPPGPTLGLEYSSKLIPRRDGTTVKAQIWDTAGQQKYRSVATDQIRKALGAVVVFDITSRKSFQSVNFWVKEHIQLVIAGNKSDRAPSRAVSYDEAAQLAHKYGAEYRETSSTELRTLNQLFGRLSEKIGVTRENEQYEPVEEGVKLQNRPPQQEQDTGRSKCC